VGRKIDRDREVSMDTMRCYGTQFSLSEKWVQIACLNPRKASAMDGVLLVHRVWVSMTPAMSVL